MCHPFSGVDLLVAIGTPGETYIVDMEPTDMDEEISLFRR